MFTKYYIINNFNAGNNDTNLKKVSGIQTFPASVIVKYFIRPANGNKKKCRYKYKCKCCSASVIVKYFIPYLRHSLGSDSHNNDVRGILQAIVFFRLNLMFW